MNLLPLLIKARDMMERNLDKRYTETLPQIAVATIDDAHQIGDDYLQKSAGYKRINAEAFTHGTSAQRMKWLKLGLTTGDISKGNTILTCSESEL